MEEQPLVSIIIPIYNVEKYLNRCIDSALNQTLKNIEIILVDDESPDNCPLICDKYAEIDKRIKVIHKRNEGLGYARNSGLAISKGEYVYFLDSDDYLDIRAVDILYKYAKINDLEISFGGIYLEDKDGNIKESFAPFKMDVLNHNEIQNYVLKGMLGEVPNAKKDSNVRMSAWQGLYSRKWLKRNHLLFPSEREFISEDIIFHLKALPCANRMGYVDKCLIYHIIDNPSSLTHKYNPQRFEKCCILYEEEKKLINNLKYNDGMLERAQRMFLGNVRVCLKQLVAQTNIIGKNKVQEKIKEYTKNKTLIEVLQHYPYWKNPIKQAIMSFLIKNQFNGAIYVLTRKFINQ